MTQPLVSVIMSVYNGATDVSKAVTSVLQQSFTDFEFLIIDNGSKDDDTAAVLQKISDDTGDRRLQVITLTDNIGLAGALNHGLLLARGKYIARQDHDDISKPERFAAQVRFMEENAHCGLLGTRAEIWRGDRPRGINHEHATQNADLQFDLLFNNPFVHSSVFIRKSALDTVGVYTTDKTRQPPEDYELWSRLARRYEVANLAELHVIYREMPKSMSRDSRNPFLERLIKISAENIAHNCGLGGASTACNDAAALIHCAYDKVSPHASIDAVCDTIIAAANHITERFPDAALTARAEQACLNLRHHHTQVGLPPRRAGLITALRRLPFPQPLKAFGRSLLKRTAKSRPA